jgi:hypothetical protein
MDLLGLRTKCAGVAALAGMYGIFAICWLPRLYVVPHFFGFNVPPAAPVHEPAAVIPLVPHLIPSASRIFSRRRPTFR